MINIKKILIISVLLLMVLLISCKSIDDSIQEKVDSPVVPEEVSSDGEMSSEEQEVEDNLNELEDLDELDFEEDFNFDDLEDFELE